MASVIKPSKFYGSKRAAKDTKSTGDKRPPKQRKQMEMTMSEADEDDEATDFAIHDEDRDMVPVTSDDSGVAASWHWTRDPVPPPSQQEPLSDAEFESVDEGLALFYDQIQCGDVTISIGDSVLLQAAEAPRPYVARVLRMFEHLGTGGLFLTIRWYLRPEETKQGRQPEHGQDELFFMTNEHKPSTYSIDCVESPCTVLNYGSYCRYRAECARRKALRKPTRSHHPVFFISEATLARRQSSRRPTRRARVEKEETGTEAGEGAPPMLDTVNTRSDSGEIPLHRAAGRGDLASVKALIKRGSNINMTDHAGWTPLHEAVAQGHTAVVEVLLKQGADPNLQSQDGIVGLHDAAELGFAKIVELLLRSGADPEVRNAQGELAMDLATSKTVKRLLSTVRKRRPAANRASKALMQAY
eukprot:TRINITY_DN11656_c0_g2_i1.p1 TRINITY_DN11656_c0_g2~~TRINITY_DN11656_c0_g2_i1.p1  ORF type:complete len:431 (+),score=100.09 TRINITY_DN11656_c0_g2_i1:53-1294(+)